MTSHRPRMMHAPGFSMWCLKNTDDPNVLSNLAPCAKKSKEKRKLLRLRLRLRRVREGHLKWRVPKPMVCLSQLHVFDDVIGSTTCRNHPTCRNHQPWASESVVPLCMIRPHSQVNHDEGSAPTVRGLGAPHAKRGKAVPVNWAWWGGAMRSPHRYVEFCKVCTVLACHWAVR